MSKELELLKRKFAREEAARIEAEQLLEKKSLELYHSNEQLHTLNTNLENLVEERTKALHETELEYSTMVESINDMIFRLDLTGKIVFTNQIVHKIIGVQNDSLLGKNVLDFIPEENRQKLFFHFARQFIKRNCINYYEVSIYSKFNKKIWLRLNVQFSSIKCKFCVRKQQALAGSKEGVFAKNDCEFNEIIVVAHDITQQKLDQVKIEKSEKRYRELTESLPELICEVDTKGILTYANKYAIDKFGYQADEVLNGQFHINSIFPESEHAQIKTNFERILRTKLSIPKEYLAKKSNGETFPVIIYTSLIIEHDKAVGLRGVMFDITERKNQEIEIEYNLRQQQILSKISMNYNSLEKFEKKTNDALKAIGEHTQVSRVYVFENSEDGQFTTNTYEWCNKGVEPQIGDLQNIPYTLIPSWKKMLEEEGIVYSENISSLPEDIRDILEPQGIKSIIVLPLMAQDRIFGFVGFDECESVREWRKSEIELLRTVANVISNNFLRQRVQFNLVESERENRVIIQSIPDVIIHADKNGEIIALKSAQKSNLSNLIKDENSTSITSTFNKNLAQLFLSAIVECLAKTQYQFEFKNLNWDEVEYYEARLVKLTDAEVLIIVRDVTVIKENEKQLEIAKNKAEEASKVKSEFLANVSHEIRTPLNAILGFSQWLHENAQIALHKEYLNSIITSGRSLLEVINNILDLSKLESGTIDVDLNPMNYKEIVLDIKSTFQHTIEEKGLNFKITTEKSVPEYILMDELRFYQIIYNLVSNAIKFTNKGFIHIFAFSSAAEHEDEINLIISIEDTGIGIKKEQQEQIFDSFTQQYGESNRSYDGTGLGLAIVDGLLKKLNGTVQVKSTEGKGTTFTLTFNNIKVLEPEFREEEHLKDDGADLQIVLDACTIMIVDDINFNIEVLKALINSPEVKYIEANDGASALQLLGTEKPDIIFMDIRMPGIDGFELTRIIKTDKLLKHIPVIAFSASTLKTKVELIGDLFDDFLQKPVFRKDLDAILVKFLPDHYRYKQKDDVEPKAITDELPEKCVEKLPEVIQLLGEEFYESWEALTGSLVIYEIEDFKQNLLEMANKYDCSPIVNYCTELEVGLQSFDIELIDKKMNEFPELIENLKSIYEQ